MELPVNPYKPGPNPRPMTGEMRYLELEGGRRGRAIGPTPFFERGDRVRSVFSDRMATVQDVVPYEYYRNENEDYKQWMEKYGEEKMWLEQLILDWDRAIPGRDKVGPSLAQHLILVERPS